MFLINFDSNGFKRVLTFIGIYWNTECESSSQLPRSVSDPLTHEMSPEELPRKSSDKRLSG
jgi:hypothetical protein